MAINSLVVSGDGQQLFPFMEATGPSELIALVGRAHVGKDEFLRCLQQLDKNVTRLALGDFVKLELARLIQRDPEWVNAHKNELRPLLIYSSYLYIVCLCR